MSTEPKMASSVSVDVCTHGTVALTLHDADSEIIGFAPMTPEVAETIIKDIQNKIAEWRAGDTIGKCEGHA